MIDPNAFEIALEAVLPDLGTLPDLDDPEPLRRSGRLVPRPRDEAASLPGCCRRTPLIQCPAGLGGALALPPGPMRSPTRQAAAPLRRLRPLAGPRRFPGRRCPGPWCP